MLQTSGPAIGPPRLVSDHFETRDGRLLPIRSWLPAHDAPSAVILALHGFNDYSNAFDSPGQYLASKGIAVYAYDQRGFGETPETGFWAGTGPMTRDLADMAIMLRQSHPATPLYLLGDSMGGAVIMVTAANATPPLSDGIILVAPAVWGRSTMPITHRFALFVAVHTLPWLKLSGRGLGIMPSDNIEMLRRLGRDPLVIKETRVDAIHGLVDLMDEALASAPRLPSPFLLLYGEKDQVIPKNAMEQTVMALPPRAAGGRDKIALYPNGYHMLLRDLQGETVLKDIVAWITHPEQPLPSGADRHASELKEDTGP